MIDFDLVFVRFKNIMCMINNFVIFINLFFFKLIIFDIHNVFELIMRKQLC